MIFIATLPSRHLSCFTCPPYNINFLPCPVWPYLFWPLPDSQLLLPCASNTTATLAPFPLLSLEWAKLVLSQAGAPAPLAAFPALPLALDIHLRRHLCQSGLHQKPLFISILAPLEVCPLVIYVFTWLPDLAPIECQFMCFISHHVPSA